MPGIRELVRGACPATRPIMPLSGGDRVVAEATPLLQHDGGMQYLRDPRNQALAGGRALGRA